MDIVVCTDHNYVMPCGVMLYSLCKNNAKHEINFHVVIDESVSTFDKQSLQAIADEWNGVNLIYIPIDGHLFDNFPNLGGGMYVTKATYYRLYLSKILPQSLNKVLYLDCDMVVRKDIGELWNTNIDNIAVAVALDGMDGLIQLYNRLAYPAGKGYFNAGMMLINLKYWRDYDVLGKCLDFIKNHYDIIVSHDQDVLNVVLQDSKVNVDITYNFGEGFLYKPQFMQFDYYKNREAIERVIHDPAIVHYTISKPWKEGCLNPFKSVFFAYISKTEWRDFKLEKTKYTKRELLKKCLYKIRLIHRELVNPFITIDFELN